MYVFGGKSGNSTKLNDLWAFNMSKHIWSEVICTDETIPEPRSGHTACLYDGTMLVFGGIVEVTKELNDVCAFSVSQKRWLYLCEDLESPVKKQKTMKQRESSPGIGQSAMRDDLPIEHQSTGIALSKKLPRNKSNMS